MTGANGGRSPSLTVVVALAGAAVVAVAAAGIGLGKALVGDLGPGAAAPPADAGVPAEAVATRSEEPLLFSSGGQVVEWDPVTFQPTLLRGPVMINTEQDRATIHRGSQRIADEAVRVPEGRWRISAPGQAKAACQVTEVDLIYHRPREVGAYRPGESHVFTLATDGTGLHLSEDCEATWVSAPSR